MMMNGRTISHYHILEKLGDGGMGVVYKAEDKKLKRLVAIKFLPPELTHDASARQRFIREAQAASALQHHNICTIHEIGETTDGRLFICMEHYEGGTLKDILSGLRGDAKTPMPPDHVVDIALQISNGLSKAHEKGIVHRDIKPANIMITDDGVVKILDFGLAKNPGNRQITRTGRTMGTLAYLSPEQASGKKMDHRTDIWSLGVVIYEMAVGKLPFEHDADAAVLYSIMDKPPIPPSRTGVSVPAALEGVILKCLQKDPKDRYQTADAISADLSRIRKESGREPAGSRAVPAGRLPRIRIPIPRAPIRGRTLWFAGSALLLILGVSLILPHYMKKVQTIRSLAVLPLENLSDHEDQNYFVSGIHEELLTDLSMIKRLRVISRTSVMRYERTRKPASAIAHELNVDALVEGSVLRVGDRMRINVQLIDGHTDRHLWAESYDRDIRDVFSLLTEVSQSIARSIAAEVAHGKREPPAGQAINPAVHEEYYRGRFLFNQTNRRAYLEALSHFQKAVRLDPRFAPAYAAQATVYAYMGIFGFSPFADIIPKARALARKALELDRGLAEAHSAMGLIKLCWDWDWPGAAEELKQALDLNPGDAFARHAYADYLTVTGRVQEGIEQVLLARDYDPLAPMAVIPSIFHQQFIRRYDKMIEDCQNLLAMNPDYPAARATLRDAYWLKGEREKAFVEYRKTWAWDADLEAALDRGYRKTGPGGALLELARIYSGKARAQTGASLQIANLYALTGAKDSAFVWLEKAFNEHAPFILHLEASPMYDSLRADPRFESLLNRIGFPKRNGTASHG
jgi:eukaryotic-like serine/threonine-protein kinase